MMKIIMVFLEGLVLAKLQPLTWTQEPARRQSNINLSPPLPLVRLFLQLNYLLTSPTDIPYYRYNYISDLWVEKDLFSLELLCLLKAKAIENSISSCHLCFYFWNYLYILWIFIYIILYSQELLYDKFQIIKNAIMLKVIFYRR